MGEREPALLVVLIETVPLRWHVAAIGSDNFVIPLLRSNDGNLDQYRNLESDAQLSFLRHRFAGVLQRGCDRLYPKGMKVSHFLLIADGHYPNASEDITPGLAEHFVEWMINPPVTYLLHRSEFTQGAAAGQTAAGPCDQFELVAGELPDDVAMMLGDSWSEIVALLGQPDRWELIARPPQSDG